MTALDTSSAPSLNSAAFDLVRDRLSGQAQLLKGGRLVFRSARYQDVAQHALGLGVSTAQMQALRAGYEASLERG